MKRILSLPLALLPWLLGASLLAAASDEASVRGQSTIAQRLGAHTGALDAAQPQTLVFVDERVPNPQSFLGDGTRQAPLIVVRRHQDGLRRIAEVASARRGWQAIHVVAHGEPGALTLGSGRLDAAAIAGQRRALSTIGASLADGGDILLYGCNVAQGSSGRAFVSALSAATRADVAASANATGSPAQGGDWVLEVASGPIDSTPLARSADQYPFLLATTDLIGAGAWTALHKGPQFDPDGDTQANKAGTEIVGDVAHSTTYANYDDNGTTGGTDPELDDILSMRVRIGDETKATHSSYIFLGFDADADDKLDGFISSGAGTTAIWDAGSGLNISPSTTDLANSPHTSYAQGAGNYNFAPVSASNDPDWDGTTDIGGDLNPDVFVSFQVQVSDLDAFLTTQLINFTPSTQLRFVALTATQTNSLNADFSGVSDSNTSDWTQTFVTLNLYSDPVDSTGVVDVTPPAPPTVDSQATSSGTPTVTGTAEPASSVDVVIDTVPYATTATAGGTWSVTVPAGNALGEGTYDVAVTSTDAAGNSSVDATSDELVIDSTAPAAPTVTSQLTSSGTPTVTGTAEAASSVDVVINTVPYATTATAGGTWSVTVSAGNALGDGTYDVAVTSTDAAGNSSVDATGDELVIDSTAPAAPTVTSQVTSSGTPTVTGTAEPASSVDVVINTVPYATTATAGGTWSVTVPAGNALGDGTYDVAVTSTDAAGNSSVDATSDELVIDSTAPVVTISSAPTASIASAAAYSVSGTCTDGDGNVTLGIPSATPASQGVSCTGGSWSAVFDVSAVPDGPNALAVTATQTDAAGNAGVDTATAGKDTIAPTLSITDNGSGGDDVYSQAEAGAVVVSGTTDAEDGQTVTVTYSDGVNAPVVTTASAAGGNWTADPADISGLAAGTITITADLDDAAGNPAPQATTNVTYTVDLPLLTADDVPPASNSFPSFTGTTDQPSSQPVTVREDLGNALCTAIPVTDSPANTWSCTTATPVSEGAYTFTAEVADAIGNTQVVNFAVAIDFDADDDGIPDAVEGAADTDGDGLPDFQDPDADNDGIPDGQEDTGLPLLSGDDSDGDGVDDAIDVDATGGGDTDGNGIDDLFEVSDLDGDGLPDYLDTDTDNDGIPDLVEGNGDTDGDGIPDFRDTDSDNDGIPDGVEDGNTPPLTGNDSDADGIDDAIDVDNTAGSDLNGDGIDDALAATDSDADGLPDHVDPDSDGDGVPDAFGVPNGPPLTGSDADGDGIDDAIDVDNTGGSDLNGDGVDDALGPADSDGDGMPDYLETDSDGDGIPDSIETGVTGVDSDLDGIDDAFDVDQTGGVDADGDGVDDAGAPDFDSDGAPNFRDLDSDNDGVLDVTEAGLPDGNGDGFVDDGSVTAAPPDADGQGGPDYLDLDRDNDGINDIVGTAAEPFDTDGDGQIDPASATDSDGDGIPDVIDSGSGGPGLAGDTDNDGVANGDDLDDDNDGIPDSVETANGNDLDSDGDGVVDRLDLDSDNDGIPDSREGPGAAMSDLDADGVLDNTSDSNGDGLADIIPASMLPVDTDLDGTPDFRDLDSDADGMADLAESAADPGALDADDDGRLDNTGDADQDGLADVVDPAVSNGAGGLPYTLKDMDRDGLANYRDTDSDGDNLLDAVENGDFDGDGMPDYLQADGGLETAVTGTGASSMDILSIILLGVWLLMRRRMTSRLGVPMVLVLLMAGQFSGPAQAADESPTATAPAPGRYALNLHSDPAPIESMPELGADDDAQLLYVTETEVDGETWYRLRLGFFATEAEAQAELDEWLAEYPNAWLVSVGPRERARFAGPPSVAPAPDEPEPKPDEPGSQDEVPVELAAVTFTATRSSAIVEEQPKSAKPPAGIAQAAASEVEQADDNCGAGPSSSRVNCWYLSAGAGLTSVDPEGESNGWSTSDDTSDGFKLLVGYRFRPHWFAELAYTDAGEAELENLNPAITGTPGITYDIASLYGGYWLREPYARWNLYGKAGVSAIWNKATDNRVDYDKQTSVQLAFGLGGQWRITQRWFARLEFDSFDRDARYLGLSVGIDLAE